MDQYPYSIPPGFHPYAGNASEKNTDMPVGTTVPGSNPYYLSGGAAEVSPQFEYGPPPTQDQQQEIVQSNPIPSAHANGLMASIPPASSAEYNAFSNPAAYAGQFPATAVEASVTPLVGLEGVYGPQAFDPQALANQSEMSYPPVNPPAAAQTLNTVDSNPMEDAAPPEALKVAQDSSELTTGHAESNSNHAEIMDKESASKEKEGTETVPNISEVPISTESNKEINESEDQNDAEPTVSSPQSDSPKVPDEPPQPSTNTESSEPPSTEQDLPPPSDASNAAPDQSTEPPVETNPPRTRSPTPVRSLSVSTEDISAASVKKKRRRIVTLNDDEDSDDEDNSNRMELLRSPEPPMVEGNDDHAAGDALANEDQRHHNRNADGSDGSEKDHEDDDRPNSSASGAVSIFQNVVMIPAGGDADAHKRKKIRVLDSDDDEDDQKVLVSVDDIGLTGEGADDLNPGGMLVDENGENDDLGTVDGIELEQMEQIVAMDAPIIDPNEMMNEDDEDVGSEAGDKDKETSDREPDGGSEAGDDERETSDRDQDGSVGSEAEQDDEEMGEEEEIVEEGVEMIAAEDDEGEAIGIATDDEQVLGEDPEQEAASDEGDNDGNRGSDAEDDQASKGDRSDAEEHSDENERQASESEKGESDENEEVRNDQSETRSSSGSNEQEKDSTSKRRRGKDDSKKSDSDDDVVCQNDLELNTISLLTDEEDDNTTPLPPPKKELPVVRIVNIKKELLDDRFGRKESTARMDAATSYQQQHYLKKQQQLAQKKREKARKRSERTFDNNDKSPHSPSNDRSVQAMKEYLKIAGFKNVKFHKLWEGCKSNQERANAILRLMQEKGLEGEPTIAKCRELRKQLQMEREAQVLDTSLIIDSGEGRITRRSARNTQNQLAAGQSLDPNTPSTSGLSQPPVVPPESLETLNRMRNVVDPDSEGEE
ncbi:protein PFC0760c-like isoform X2 [Armigeres subalbatus]|uniref:protein PFC0760c-like isoform X2 n=1 Tax=Armigeres subalbatus TaxID=124917 RepID=UPI002ED58AC7